MAFVALLLTGSYSVSAALGSAMGGRANAAIEQQDKSDNRAKVQTAYDTAKSELDTLTTAKPATELQTLIDSAKAELAKLPATRPVAEIDALIRGAAMNPRGSHGCTAINGSLRMYCPKLEPEKARAAQRDRLTANIGTWTTEIAQADQRRANQRERSKAAMEKAAAELSNNGPAKVANSDAVALAGYLQALGVNIDADRINKLLVLLAVLCIECGGGLALAVGMALGEGSPLAGGMRGADGSLRGTLPSPPATAPLPPGNENAGPDGTNALVGSLPSRAGGGARERLLGMLCGGQGLSEAVRQRLAGHSASVGRASGSCLMSL